MKLFILLFVIIFIAGCASPQPKENAAKKPDITDLADRYYETYLEFFPEQAYFNGIDLKKHDAIENCDIKTIAAWKSFEDSIYRELLRIDLAADSPDKAGQITYWMLKEKLESSIQLRDCNLSLWYGVNHLSGWQKTYSAVAELQPVGTSELRAQAISRWKKIPGRVKDEINNLREGLSKGYSTPKEIVQLVISQVDVLLDYSLQESPFMSPALRDGDSTFYREWLKLIENEINPSLKGFRKFLKEEYIVQARDSASVLTIPVGDKCYQAFIRAETTRNILPEEIYHRGRTIVEENEKKISQLGSEWFRLSDFSQIIKKLHDDPQNRFKSEAEIMDFSSSLITRAKEKCKLWFSVLPSKSVILKPYEAHESGVGSYETAIGGQPAYYRITLKDPPGQRKSDVEKTGYHETYPGHHLQIGIQQDLKDMHPLSKLVNFGSFVEGWARYSEMLAEEMELYFTKGALISRRAWPSRGMVFDPGVHLKHWTKEMMIIYCMESGANKEFCTELYYRCVVSPGQLTSYDVGGQEIIALRDMAKERLGNKFDIREFHSKVLENGSVPMEMLRLTIEHWIAQKQ